MKQKMKVKKFIFKKYIFCPHFCPQMVSNTEAMNANQFIGSGSGGAGVAPTSSSGGSGAIGRLRQTLQQAQETVSNRLTQTRAGYQTPTITTTDMQANEQNIAISAAADAQQNSQQQSNEEKENQEAA